MKLTGNLKKQVEQTESKEEAKKVIEDAGMLLTDDELDRVAGGGSASEDKPICQCSAPDFGPNGKLMFCNNCGRPRFASGMYENFSFGIS